MLCYLRSSEVLDFEGPKEELVAIGFAWEGPPSEAQSKPGINMVRVFWLGLSLTAYLGFEQVAQVGTLACWCSAGNEGMTAINHALGFLSGKPIPNTSRLPLWFPIPHFNLNSFWGNSI